MDLDWQNNIFRVEERTEKLLEKGLFADVTFSLCTNEALKETKIIRAHKLILATASSVFEAMFYGPMAEKTDEGIEITETEITTFEAMLKYIYSNKIELNSWKETTQLYGAAKKYMLNELLKYCVDHLIKILSAENAIKIYEFAKFYEEEILLERALEIIKNNTKEVLNSPDFIEIDAETLITILEQHGLQATAVELFAALENLAEAHKVFAVDGDDLSTETELKRVKMFDHFRTAVKRIDFLAMTVEEFANGPSCSKLLLPEESVAIFGCLILPEKNLKHYPKEFLYNNRGRLLKVYFDLTDNLNFRHKRIVIEFVIPNDTPILLQQFFDYFECTKLFANGTTNVFAENFAGSLSFCTHSKKAIFQGKGYGNQPKFFGHIIEGIDILDDFFYLIRERGEDFYNLDHIVIEKFVYDVQ